LWLVGVLWLVSVVTALWAAQNDPFVVLMLSFTTVGGLVAWLRPSHPVGWLLLIDGMVWTLGAAAHRLVTTSDPVGASQVALVAFMDLFGWIIALGLIPLAVLLFPAGRFHGRIWRAVGGVIVVGGVVLGTTNLLTPGSLPSESVEAVNPFGVDQFSAVSRIVAPVAEIVFFLGVILGLVSVVVRFVKSSGVERQQFRWLAFAASLMLLGFAIGAILSAFGLPGEPFFNTVAMPMVPIAMGIALLRYRLWDLDVVVSKTLVYGFLAMAIAAAYVIVVAGFGALVGGGTSSEVWLAVLATAIAATLFQPARQGAMTAARRMVFRRPDAPELAIRTLGGFRVERDGKPVSSSEWRSKKARQLLKMLLARYDRPTHREQLIEALWPEDEDGNLANRLAVAASTIRSTLDPDKRHPSDHYLIGEDDTLRLDPDHLWIDVAEFLNHARAGLGDDPERLLEADTLYRGDFLEEDVYEDWAQPLREEARGTYVAVLRKRAEIERENGVDLEVTALLRILEVDPWDEPAHQAVVSALKSAGRHGEARRAYHRYEARMKEIGVTPTRV
jgi:DNA-binding SARP family transcriptional activator